MAARRLTLREIALMENVTVPTACRMAKRYGWLVVRPANRRLGVPALYDYHAVQRDLAERDQRQAA